MWFDGTTAGWIGALLGSSIGIIVGGVWNTFSAKYAPRGKYRGIVLNTAKCFIAVGLLLLLTGGFAFFSGQPYHVWYPFSLFGTILLFMMPFRYRYIKKIYTEAELKKMYIDDMK